MNQTNRIARSIYQEYVSRSACGFLINTLPRFSKNKAHIPTLCMSAPGTHQSSITIPSAIELEMVKDLFSTVFYVLITIYHNNLLKVIN